MNEWYRGLQFKEEHRHAIKVVQEALLTMYDELSHMEHDEVSLPAFLVPRFSFFLIAVNKRIFLSGDGAPRKAVAEPELRRRNARRLLAGGLSHCPARCALGLLTPAESAGGAVGLSGTSGVPVWLPMRPDFSEGERIRRAERSFGARAHGRARKQHQARYSLLVEPRAHAARENLKTSACTTGRPRNPHRGAASRRSPPPARAYCRGSCVRHCENVVGERNVAEIILPAK